MLTLFPSPYEDELLYSLCARYGRLMGHGNLRTTLYHLFGRSTMTAVGDLPTHLDALAERLSGIGGPPAAELIDRHTLLPYFAAFQSVEKRQEARTAMHQEGRPHWLLGLMASRIPGMRSLRYCPICANTERMRFGEAYWHRAHQLPGVLVCQLHEVWLEESEVTLPAPVARHAFISAEKIIPHKTLARHIPDGVEGRILTELAQRASTLLVIPPPSVTPSELRYKYLNALAERQMATYSGQLRVGKLRAAFLDFIPVSLLKTFGLDGNDIGWLLKLLRKPRTSTHTLYHLLLQAFLNLEAEILGEVDQPFGEAPWPCLNRASDHYGEQLIQHVQVDFTSNACEPIGTFTCVCGFSYRRVGPDRVLNDRMRFDRMAAYGSVWENALRRSWPDSTLSLRELSRRLGFDPKIVRKRAGELGLPIPRPGGRKALPIRESKSRSLPTEIRAEHREAWRQARLHYPDATTSQLRKSCPAAYSWLHRNDRRWLSKHKPVVQARKAAPPRVDWDKRDLQLSRNLRRIATKLIRKEPATRITASRLGRELKQATLLSRHLGKLPLCQMVLTEVTETREQFAIRRIQLTTDKLISSGERIPRWKFMRRCGLREDLLAVPEVRHVFDQAWKRLLIRFEVPAA